MSKNLEEFQEYIKILEKFKLPDYKNLPEIPLYMEQVISYIENILSGFFISKDQLITPFMVNNYVKAKIIDSPNAKKYDKEQIGYLLAIVLMKQVASMKDIATMIDLDKNYSEDKQKLYTFFKDIIEETLKNEIKKVKLRTDTIAKNSKTKKSKNSEDNFDLKEDSNLVYIALRLYIQSQINKLIADQIMSMVGKDLLPENLVNSNKTEKKVEKIKNKTDVKKLSKR